MLIKICTTDIEYLHILNKVFKKSITNLIYILNKDILSVSADALIIPTNSFGFIDKNRNELYKYFFGCDIGSIIQKEIKLLDHDLLIGESIFIPLDCSKIHNLIVSPVIRSKCKTYTLSDPLSNILITDNIYLATKSSISTAINCNVKSISVPIMNITSSKIDEELVCKAMLLGIQDAIYPYPFPRYPSDTYLMDRDIDKLLSYTGE